MQMFRRTAVVVRIGRAVVLPAIVVEDEQPDRRRQIAVLAFLVDRRHEIGQRYVAADRDFLKSVPESILKTDTCLVTCNHDGSFDNLAFHSRSPVSSRC